MLNQPDIDAIAAEVARANLPSGALVSVSSRPYESFSGDEELMVKVVIRDVQFPNVTGGQFGKIVGDLQQELLGRGEMRFAHIEWNTDAPPMTDEDD